MKNKGFTLAELLGVIVVLGLICLVAFPPILDAIKKSKKNIGNSTNEIIYGATKIYMNNRPSEYKLTPNSTYCIKIQTLIDSGDLVNDLKDSTYGDPIDTEQYVKVIVENNDYKYSIEMNC